MGYAFSAYCTYLVTACFDYYVKLWGLFNDETVRQYNECVALNDIRCDRTEHKPEIFQPGNEINYNATKLVQQ